MSGASTVSTISAASLTSPYSPLARHLVIVSNSHKAVRNGQQTDVKVPEKRSQMSQYGLSHSVHWPVDPNSMVFRSGRCVYGQHGYMTVWVALFGIDQLATIKPSSLVGVK